MAPSERRERSRAVRYGSALALGCLIAGSAAADPPGVPGGVPFQSLQRQITDLDERVDGVERDLQSTRNRLSQVVDVVDLTEALRLCVRIFEGRLGGLPGPHWIFSGCNVHVRAGNLATDAEPNARGNLVVGYNEGSCTSDLNPPGDGADFSRPCLTDAECPAGESCFLGGRQGSHNLVVGHQHGYSSFGGIVGGRDNQLGGAQSSVLGGFDNRARGPYSTVSGGSGNEAAETAATVAGGLGNFAFGTFSAVLGGEGNLANAPAASISGGHRNHATGRSSSVGGGDNRTAEGEFDWRAGELLEDR